MNRIQNNQVEELVSWVIYMLTTGIQAKKAEKPTAYKGLSRVLTAESMHDQAQNCDGLQTIAQTSCFQWVTLAVFDQVCVQSHRRSRMFKFVTLPTWTSHTPEITAGRTPVPPTRFTSHNIHFAIPHNSAVANKQSGKRKKQTTT